MRYLLLLSLIVYQFETAYAQKYLELMQQEHVNFYEVQREAEKYFANREKGRGSGYKQYKRWEYIHQKEIDENGFIINAKQVWEEQDKFLKDYISNQTAHQKGKGPNKSLTGNWTSLGPTDWNRTSGWNPGVGRVVCIDVDDNNQNLIYAGSPSGGLWKTIDGGNNWQVLTDSFPTMDIWAVEIDPTNSNIVYMATAGGGILKTNDGGQNWNQTGSISGTVKDILIHPINNNIVFAAKSSGVFRSTNGGASWSQVSSVGAEDIQFKPGNTNIVYACGNDFQRSTNGGQNWTTITSGIIASERMKLATTPANPNYVYLIQKSGSIFGQVYRSTDSGLNFNIRAQYNGSNNYLGYSPNGTSTLGQAWRDMAITASNTNADEIIIAGIIVFKSTDGGVNYTALTNWSLPNSTGYVHADVEVLHYIGNTLYVGSDGGIYKSTDNGSNFTDLTPGMGIREFYRMGCSQTDPNVVSGGSQDNGTSVMRGASQSWVDWLGADGMETFVDYTNANILYGTSQYGSMYYSTNQGNSRSSMSKPPGVGNGEWVTPFEIDPVNPNTLYVGFDRLFKCTNAPTFSPNWTAISTASIGSGNMDEIALAPSDPNTIYVSYGTQIYRTTDGGSNWASLIEPWGGFINYISVDPDNPQRVAVAVSGGSKAYLSTNGGNTWSNITANLPSIGANCILLDASPANGIYIGMQSGVYYKDDFLGNWIPFLTDLPRVRVLELEIVNSVGKIRAATYGRGLWESDVYSGNNSNLPPVANFSASQTTAVIGQAIQFNDNSSGAPNIWNWSFPGGSPSSSTLQNPGVSYASPGSYNVSLSVTNANGSDSETKNSYITITPYCIPDPANGTNDGDYIDGVVLGTISNLNTGSSSGPSYNDYTSQSTGIARNSNQTISITSGSYTQDHYAVWIDYNQDNDFNDPGEKLGEVLSSVPFQSLNIPFTVPTGALLGVTTMRVRCAYNAANMDPCTDYTWGETEDYSVNILNAVACTPTFSTGTSDGDFIDGVEFGTLSNLNTGSATGPDYTNYANISCEVSKADTHYIKITSGSYFTDVYAVWIDWNQNDDFTDPGEKIGEFQTNTAFETDSIAVILPITLDTGFYAMRVRCAYNQFNMSPCAQYTWGETEDYRVRVIPSSDLCIMPSSPIAINDSVCGEGVLNLAVIDNGGIYNWYLSNTSDSIINSGANYSTSVLNASQDFFVAENAEQIGNSISTFYASNAASNGNLFNIKSAKNIRIDGFDVNLSGTGSQEILVYYKTGTYLGFETNPNAWTLLGRDTVIGQGLNNPTYVDIGGLEINQEELYGILIYSPQGGFRYSNLGTDSVIYNEDIILEMGKGMSTLFTTLFSPRIFNGSVHYTKYAGCESARTTVSAIVNPLPQIQLNAPATLCINDAAINVNASPAGGIFSGDIASGGLFDPQAQGLGFHDIIYTYTDNNSCSNSDTIQIEVKDLPNVSLSALNDMCLNESPIILGGGTPSGGTFSGVGVASGTFDPSVAGIGTHQIDYTYTDNFGCSDFASRTITVNPLPAVNFSQNSSFCEGSPVVTLNGGIPAGGFYSGNGVTGNSFDPVLAGVGNHLIQYVYQDVNSCSDTATLSFAINAKPNVTHPNISSVCENASPINLNGGSPSGGIYNGLGVSGNSFDPQLTGSGVFNLSYSYTDVNSCTDSTIFTVDVKALPVVTLNAFSTLCENDGTLPLSGGNPGGGIYSGTGVSNGQFDPAIAGAGTHLITYSFTDAFGCSNSDTKSITVNPSPNVSFSMPSTFCEGDQPELLSGGSPAGGTYFGNGINGTLFDPNLAGVGNHLISYAYTNSSGCADTSSLTFTVNPKPVITHSAFSPICENSSAISLSGGVPAGGVYSGLGVSNNTFNPQITGVGNHTIFYSFTNGDGCSDSISVNIQVTSLPIIVLNPLPNICENEAPFTLSGAAPSGGFYSGTGVNNGVFDPSITGAGTFNITYTFTDNNGCSNSDSKSITVFSAPQTSLILGQSFCENDPAISLTGGSPSGGNYFGPGVIGSNFDPQLSGIGTHSISYVYTNANNCSDTASDIINVNQNPVVTHTSIPDLCSSDTAITLSGGSPLGGIYSGPGVSNGMFDPQITGTGSFAISYSYTNASGCTDTAVFGINVLNSPNVIFNGLSDICENAGPQALTSGSPFGGTYSGTGVSGNTFDPTISGIGTFIISYSFTNAAGCSGIDYDTITVFSLPNVSLDTLPSVCENDPLFALSGGLPVGGLYSGNGVTNGNFDPSIAGAGITQISYVFADANGCISQANENILVKPSPQSAFGYNINGQTANFIDSSSNAAGWHWTFGDGDSSSIQNPSHTYASGGNYNVCLTVNNNGCMDQFCDIVAVISNLSSDLKDENIQFFPNPFSSEVNYRITSAKSGKYLLNVIDVRSVVQKSYEIEMNAGQNEGTLNLGALSSGTYFISIISESEVKTRKIEKLK